MRLSLALAFLIIPLVIALPRSGAAPAGTLDRLTQQLDHKLRRALGARPLGEDDLALALASSRGIPADLLRRVRDLLRGRLQSGFRSVGEIKAASAEQRRRSSRAAGFELLLDLSLRVKQGHLLLQGDLVDTRRSFWRDMGQPARGSLNYIHVGVRVDAEVRTFLGPLRGGAIRFSPRKIPLGWRPPLAVAAGDVDGDGQTELVVLYSYRLSVMRHDPVTGNFKELSSLELDFPRPNLRPRRAMGSLQGGGSRWRRAVGDPGAIERDGPGQPDHHAAQGAARRPAAPGVSHGGADRTPGYGADPRGGGRWPGSAAR